jgi:hypothetical protein
MPSRTAIGWALLFAVPPGVGVTGYASMLMGGRLVEPMAVGIGALVAGAIFAVVLGAQLTGAPEPETVRERVD